MAFFAATLWVSRTNLGELATRDVSIYVLDFVQKSMRPSNRPDLNPIEHMWPLLINALDVAQLEKRRRNVQVVRDACNNIREKEVRDLCASMKRGMTQEQERDGGITDY